MIHADILKKVQLSGALIVLICTVIGFGLEIYEMFNNRMITLPDLLLLFIYLEVLGMVTSFWGSLKSSTNLSFVYNFDSFS